MFVLDTDTLSLWWRKQERVVAKVLSIGSSAPLVITIVTRIEVLEGRFSHVCKASSGVELGAAVQRLSETILWLSKIPELAFDDRSVANFDRLRGMRKLNKVGRKDLLMACICLAQGAILVTRNVKDFAPVPGLQVENWAD